MLSRLADLIGQHPKRALIAVLAFVLIAGALGGPVAGALDASGGFSAKDADSAVAIERIEQATGRQASPGVVLLVDDPTDGRLADLAAELSAEPGIATATPAGESRDGSQAIVAATLRASADEDDVATALQERFEGEQGVAVGGQLIAQTQIGEAVSSDLGRAELLAFPILLLLSLLFFRGRAAWLPLAVGVTTVLGTFLALSAVNQVYGLSIFALNLVIGLGLGLAIDYTLFLVSRYREELEAKGPGAAAVRATMASAGHTVGFSAVTVAVALITLTVFPLGFLQSMGMAGAIVALVAAAASLVICPALFTIWGAKLAITRKRERPQEQGAWYRLSHLVMRRPALIAGVTAAVMLAAALPALRAEWTPVDATVIPKDQSARTVADALQNDFPGQDTTPTMLVVEAPRSAGAQVEAYAASLEGMGAVRSVQEPRSLDGDTWQIDVDVAGRPEGEGAQALVETIRDGETAFPVLVGGVAAEFVDQQEAIGSRLGLAAGLLALLTFAVLWLMTGSVVLPIKAIAMNVLTVGASLGLLTFIYQDGRLEGLLNYTSNGGIEPTDFLVATAVVFALSTDYGVFLLGRIKEARDAGVGEREAVALGLERTGRVVTAAAILLAVAIGAFSTSSISFIQQVGVATAVGVLLDAFVVRALLVPALMALLGKWNWWSPMGLRRMRDRIRVAEAKAAAAEG